ncbi:MAG: recombinase family protein [Chloroflexi bacterium]|nr:recombinase family protein [Chloroflexota bacterium]
MDKLNFDPKKLGAAYIRYSSTMQDDSFSLDAQLRQIKSRAISDGIEIVKIYSDPATSAYKNKYRPGIAQMLEDSRRGMFGILYVHKVDRLARRLEWAIEIVKQLQKEEVTLNAVEQNFNLDTPEGKLTFHLLGSLGEFYSDNLSKETHKGKYERAMQGYHNGWVPWGYNSEKVGDRKMAVQDPINASIAEEMFERYSKGFYYDQQIADWLNLQGVRTFRKHPFTKDSVRVMLQNPFYTGYVTYRGAFIQGKSHRGKGEMIKGAHQPIISEDLFVRCQKVRSLRRRTLDTKPYTRHAYLLSGIITCKLCEKKMRAQSAKAGRYYRDASRFSGLHCSFSGKSVRADVVEEQIGRLMESLVLPDNWQIRRMREAYKRGLYEGDEHSFWRDVEALQMQLEVIEQITPHEVRQAAVTLLGLQEAWNGATPDERKVLCQILLQDVVFDFVTNTIVSIRPKSEYAVLFQMVTSLQAIGDGSYVFHSG